MSQELAVTSAAQLSTEFQPFALFVWIDPVARRQQRETSFDQSGDEDRAKTQTTHISCFEHAQATLICSTEGQGL